ncbi:MAG: hypothetical protein ABR956_10945 [Terracidiphilus sp.]|jgi:hypothetical protein
MNRTKANPTESTQSAASLTAIDRILSSEDALVPRSGFLASVIESIHEQARLPRPIPFPWKRVIPGVLLLIGALVWGAIELVHNGLPAGGGTFIPQPHLSVAPERPLQQATWVALALGVSLFSWLLSRRLTGQSALL